MKTVQCLHLPWSSLVCFNYFNCNSNYPLFNVRGVPSSYSTGFSIFSFSRRLHKYICWWIKSTEVYNLGYITWIWDPVKRIMFGYFTYFVAFWSFVTPLLLKLNALRFEWLFVVLRNMVQKLQPLLVSLSKALYFRNWPRMYNFRPKEHMESLRLLHVNTFNLIFYIINYTKISVSSTGDARWDISAHGLPQIVNFMPEVYVK